MTPDQLIAAYHRASQLGATAATDAQRYADARCVALLALVTEHGESLSVIAERVGLTRARVQQMTARARRTVTAEAGYSISSYLYSIGVDNDARRALLKRPAIRGRDACVHHVGPNPCPVCAHDRAPTTTEGENP